MSPPPARVDELKKRYEENPRRFFAPLANEYRKAGDLEAAIDLCRMHLEEQPGHLSGHIVYGQALYEAGRAVDAQKAFESALELDPENLIALRHLGDIGKAIGDTTVATQWYQRVLDADPRNDEVIALIAALQQAEAARVIVAEEPPPPPQLADEFERSVQLPFIDSSAPTPVIAMPVVAEHVPSVAAPRESTGLMDLNLHLGEETPPSADLLGLSPVELGEPDIPREDIGEALFEEGFPIDAFTSPAGGSAPPELSADGDMAVLPDSQSLDFIDTSFGAGLPADEPSAFDRTDAGPVFGDSLDIPDAPVVATAAPAPGDFDALFGGSPIADVHVGGDSAPEPTDDHGFVADAFVGSEQVSAVPPDSVEAEAGVMPAPFVTETMAELYLQQGFRDEALAVYRQLLAQNPDDAGLAGRVLRLEQGAGPNAMSGRAGRDIQAPVVEAPAPPMAPAGPTAREVLGRLAQRRALPGGGAPTSVSETATPAAPSAAPSGGSIDQLFGTGVVTDDDEGAAASVAAAFDAGPVATVAGQPTYAGTEELSLGSVFHGDAGAVPSAPAVQRQSTKLRFDQFFAGVDGASASSPAVEAPQPPAPGGSEEDISQFNDWLKGLKGS